MLGVIPRLAALAWKYGKAAVTRAIAWARKNKPTVDRWVRVGGYAYAIEMVLRAIGVL